MRVAEIRARD